MFFKTQEIKTLQVFMSSIASGRFMEYILFMRRRGLFTQIFRGGTDKNK